jgi:hypothetical protein
MRPDLMHIGCFGNRAVNVASCPARSSPGCPEAACANSCGSFFFPETMLDMRFASDDSLVAARPSLL